MSVVHCSLSVDGVLQLLTQCGIILSIYCMCRRLFSEEGILKIMPLQMS